MATKLTQLDINNIIEKHFIDHLSVGNIAKQYGVANRTITNILEAGGRTALNFKGWHYDVFTLKCCIALYAHGVGLRGISERLGVGIGKLRNELIKQGVHIRTQSEQELIKWSIMSKEQRLEQVKKAHSASVGRVNSDETLRKIAQARAKRSSVYEKQIEDIFVDAGIAFEPQFPIDKYNIDFLVGNIAMEVFGGGWHSHGKHFARFGVRSEKIFDSGYGLVIIQIRDRQRFSASFGGNLVKFINQLRFDESSAGKYWVIWGDFKAITTGSRENVELALVNPFTNVRDRETGRYQSVARNTVEMGG